MQFIEMDLRLRRALEFKGLSYTPKALSNSSPGLLQPWVRCFRFRTLKEFRAHVLDAFSVFVLLPF
jgi:hypothetical protein